MVELTVNGGALHVEVLGWSRLLGLNTGFDLPLNAITGAAAGSGMPAFAWGDIRAPGTGIPHVAAVGTYWMGKPRRKAFIDTTRWSKQVVTIEAQAGPYQLVIAEVKDADAALRLIESARAGAPGATP